MKDNYISDMCKPIPNPDGGIFKNMNEFAVLNYKGRFRCIIVPIGEDWPEKIEYLYPIERKNDV